MKRFITGIALILSAALLILPGCGAQSAPAAAQASSAAPASAPAATPSSTATSAAAPELSLMLYWGTADNEFDPFAIAAHSFTDIVEAKSNGRIEIVHYPNSVLGAERDAFEGVSMGTIDMALINSTPIGGFVPQSQITDMPYLFPDKETIFRIFANDHEIGKEINDAIFDAYNVMSLGIYDGGFRQMYNNVRPVATPEDMKGIKFRSMENTVYLEMFKSLGANPTAMAYTEVFTGLQQGTVDGFEIGIATYFTNNFNEVTKYMSLTNHTFTPIRLLMSGSKWKTIPADLQKILLESVEESLPIARAKNDANEGAILDKIRASGVQVNELTAPDAFSEKCAFIWEMFRDAVGSDLLDKVLKECGKA